MAYNNLLQQQQLATAPGFLNRVKAAMWHAAQAVATEALGDVQTLSVSGSPTGGTFTLTLNGNTSAAIAFNATAGAVQLALQNTTGIGSGNVACTGGPLPGTAVVINFIGTLGNTAQNLLTHTDSFTGGASPAASIAHTIVGASYANHAARVGLIGKIIGNPEMYAGLFAYVVADNATVQTDLNPDGTANSVTETTILNDIEFVINSIWNTFI